MPEHFLSTVFTVLMPILFLGIVLWAYGRKRSGAFAEAAMLPFADDELARSSLEKETQHG
jgi:cytochrome c oxidase cbb3-type subunit IV